MASSSPLPAGPDPTGGDGEDLSTESALFHQLDSYPWSEDEEFQGGLRAILGTDDPHADSAQVAHLTLRAKCYYFARRAGVPVDFDAYKTWVDERAAAEGDVGEGRGDVHAKNVNGGGIGATAEDGLTGHAELNGKADGGGGDEEAEGGISDAPKPASFAEICEMIAEGRPIPGIKTIPDTILEGQASESTASKRKKPWEKEATADSASGLSELSWMS